MVSQIQLAEKTTDGLDSNEVEDPIPRSSDFSRKLYLLKIGAPKLVAPFIRFAPAAQERKDIWFMRRCLLENSKTFSAALHSMYNDAPIIYDDLTLIHQGFKLIDFCEEDKLLARNKDYQQRLMFKTLDTIRYPTKEKVLDLESRLKTFIGHEEFDNEFESLLRNTPRLIRAFQGERQEVRDIFLRYAERMVKGFLNPSVQNVRDMAGVDRYCYYAAVLVGDAIQDEFCHRGYLSNEQLEELRVPARRMGKGVQISNNLRDLFKDYKNGLWRWPREYVEPLVSFSTEAEFRQAYNDQFSYLVDYTRNSVLDATEYLDKLPKGKPYGPKIFTALGLLAYALYVGRVSNENFVRTRGNYQKITKDDALELRDIATYHAQKGTSYKGIVEHLINGKPPSTYRNAL